MTLQFTYVRLLVSNFEACFIFYRDVMGFDISWGDKNGAYAEFKTGDTKLALFKQHLMAEAVGNANQPSFLECQDRSALIFAVGNVDETYQQLTKKDVRFVTEPCDHPDWGTRTAHFRDPDGNLIEINSNLGS
ncbi:MAG: VOC family protein [Hassallia sp.]